MDELKVGTKLQAKADGVFYAAQVVEVSSAKKRAKAPVKVHYIGYGDADDMWLPLDDLKSKLLKGATAAAPAKSAAKPATKAAAAAPAAGDLSALTPGTRVQAMADGVKYSAEVMEVSTRTSRAKAPVKVHFVGYSDADDMWLSVDNVKSKLLKAAPAKATKKEAAEPAPAPAKKSAKAEKAPAAEKAPKVDFSVLEKDMRIQVEYDGVWYAAKIKTISKAKNRAKAPVNVHFAGHDDSTDEWVGADRIRSKLLKPPEKEAKAAKATAEKPIEKKAKSEKEKKTPEKKEKAAPAAKKEPRRRFSTADQIARFARAKEENNERYLNIGSVFKGDYLKGKKVLVVGASRGLGLEIVKEAIANGAEVVLTCRKSSSDLASVGAKQIIEGVEVTDVEAMKKMASQITGPIEYCIFNAGYFPDITDNLDNMQMAEAMKQIDICGLGPVRCVSALKGAGLLKGCKVAIITSQAGSAQWRFTQNKDKGGDYGHHMSRAACNIGCALMSEELKKDEVPVVMLHPGFNRTEMTSKFSHIWDIEGAVPPADGAKRVLHEVALISMKTSGKFFNCEDGLEIPF